MPIDITKAREWWAENESRQLTGMEALAVVLEENARLTTQLNSLGNEADAARTRVEELEREAEQLRKELGACESIYETHTNQLRERIRSAEAENAELRKAGKGLCSNCGFACSIIDETEQLKARLAWFERWRRFVGHYRTREWTGLVEWETANPEPSVGT